jgi:hypothetical protein
MKLTFWKSYQEIRRTQEAVGWQQSAPYEVPDATVERWNKALSEFDRVQREMAEVIKDGRK